VYSHDKTYLPSGRWWDDEQKRGAIRLISIGLSPRQDPAFLHYIIARIDGRIACPHGAEMDWSENVELLKYFGDGVDDPLEYAAHRSRGRGPRGRRGRSRGRTENWGFTDDEVQELLCQGVKPWDDDARVSAFGLSTWLYSSFFLTLVLGCS